MAINKVEYAGETLMDITDSTVEPASLMAGAVAYNAAGERIEGEMAPIFLVRFYDDEDEKVACDLSFSEVLAAMDAGLNVMGIYNWGVESKILSTAINSARDKIDFTGQAFDYSANAPHFIHIEYTSAGAINYYTSVVDEAQKAQQVRVQEIDNSYKYYSARIVGTTPTSFSSNVIYFVKE